MLIKDSEKDVRLYLIPATVRPPSAKEFLQFGNPGRSLHDLDLGDRFDEPQYNGHLKERIYIQGSFPRRHVWDCSTPNLLASVALPGAAEFRLK